MIDVTKFRVLLSIENVMIMYMVTPNITNKITCGKNFTISNSYVKKESIKICIAPNAIVAAIKYLNIFLISIRTKKFLLKIIIV